MWRNRNFFRFDIEYATEYNLRYSKDAREILELLQFAPKVMVEYIKNVLRKFKKEYENGVKEL